MLVLPLLVALSAAAPPEETAPEPPDEEFEPARSSPSLVFAAAAKGHAAAAAEVGWLRSGAGVALGLGPALDLSIRASAFLLHGLLREQKEVFAGVRWIPVSDGLLRGAAGLEAGFVQFGSNDVPTSTFAFRGEVAGGVAVEGIATAYVRGALRLVTYRDVSRSGFGRDEELGLGVERAFGPWVAGVEAFSWVRPGLRPLPQWRLRAGRAF